MAKVTHEFDLYGKHYEDVLTREEFDRSNKEPKAAEPTPAEAKEQPEE